MSVFLLICCYSLFLKIQPKTAKLQKKTVILQETGKTCNLQENCNFTAYFWCPICLKNSVLYVFFTAYSKLAKSHKIKTIHFPVVTLLSMRKPTYVLMWLKMFQVSNDE